VRGGFASLHIIPSVILSSPWEENESESNCAEAFGKGTCFDSAGFRLVRLSLCVSWASRGLKEDEGLDLFECVYCKEKVR